ncbi:hypothetical protein Hanom_Chr17g01585751 [Helianthus anomalus]
MSRLMKVKDKLHALSFIVTSLFRRCPQRILTGFALYRKNPCTLRPLALTQLVFLVTSDHVDAI